MLVADEFIDGSLLFPRYDGRDLKRGLGSGDLLVSQGATVAATAEDRARIRRARSAEGVGGVTDPLAIKEQAIRAFQEGRGGFDVLESVKNQLSPAQYAQVVGAAQKAGFVPKAPALNEYSVKGLDVVGNEVIRITKSASGSGYDCEVTRAGNGQPVRLVAAASSAGKLALERANGRESSVVPGFIEVTAPLPQETSTSVRDHIARCFGLEQ